MDFNLTDEQTLLVENVKELMLRECPESYFQQCDANHEFPAKAWQVLADNGLLALNLSPEYGGQSADALTTVLVQQALGRYAQPISLYYSNATILIPTWEKYFTQEQKDEILPRFARGELQIGSAITEPQAGSDDAAMTTTARVEGDTVVLNGQKTWATNSHQAQYFMVITRDVDNPSRHGAMTAWLVPMDTPGITVVPIPKMGWHTEASCDVYLDNVRLPLSSRIGREGQGWEVIISQFGVERACMAAMCLGWAEAALDDAAEYANKRVQFGNPIGTYQLVQKRIADMALKCQLARDLVYRVAWMVDTGQPLRVEAAMAKLYASVIAAEVTDDAMQVMGGVGITSGARVSRLWRDARIARIAGGTDEMMYRAIAPMVLKQYQ